MRPGRRHQRRLSRPAHLAMGCLPASAGLGGRTRQHVPVLEAMLTALGLVFVAELGDKTQLLTLAYATRYHWAVVLAGVAAATALLNAIAVAVGAALSTLPTRAITIGAGVLFLAFAVWTVLGDRGGEDDDDPAPVSTGSAFWTVAGGFFLAELGDKTQLATAAIAARGAPFAVWLGATVAMVAADLVAIVVGRVLGARLPERAIRWVAAALFAAFGLWLLIDGITGGA